jgi:tetratricopeptide (TPR) repeat protein
MPGHQNKLSLFWQEIKRRNVHRSLAIYAGTAFIILEAADIIFPRLGLPDWSIDVVLYLLILGAVVTLVVSWIFDLTSKGVEKTKALNEMQAGDIPVVSYGWKIATYVSLVVIVGLIIFNLAGGFKQVQAGSIQSLVVLPFDNFTGNEELDYFVSGMHASLIGDMGKINGLRVVSKTTSNTFKDLDNWVIKDIANEIRLPLSPEQQTQLAKPRPIDPDAYELYLKGKFHMGFLTRESQQSALDYFNKALEIDPEYASAYAGIAGVWAFLKQMDYVTPDEANLKLEEFMSRALQLDNPSAEVYYYDGIKKVWTDFDWEGGESSLMRCLEINPNFSEARAYYSHLMMLLKRPEEMREQITLALEIDPKNPLIQVLATVELMIESKYDLCIDRAKQLQTMMPNNPLLMLVLFQSYTETDEYDLAIIELRKVFKQLADDIVIETLDREYSKAGFEKALNAAADNWTERFTGASAQHATMLYAYAGNTEKTLFWLERAYIRRDPSNPYLGVIPYLRPYHDEPRYIEIVQRMKLPIGAFDS